MDKQTVLQNTLQQLTSLNSNLQHQVHGIHGATGQYPTILQYSENARASVTETSLRAAAAATTTTTESNEKRWLFQVWCAVLIIQAGL